VLHKPRSLSPDYQASYICTFRLNASCSSTHGDLQMSLPSPPEGHTDLCKGPCYDHVTALRKRQPLDKAQSLCHCLSVGLACRNGQRAGVWLLYWTGLLTYWGRLRTGLLSSWSRHTIGLLSYWGIPRAVPVVYWENLGLVL